MRKNINAVVINTHFDERYKISILSSGLARKFLKLFFSDILDFIKFGNIVKRIQISPKIYEKMSISQDELQKIAEKLSKIPGDNSKLL